MLDNGKGITKQQISDPKSFGIMGMRERANLWEGKFRINCTRGKGTGVAASIPIKAEETIPYTRNISKPRLYGGHGLII